MEASDAVLVGAVCAGDRAAFGLLVERHRPLLLRLVSRLLAAGPQDRGLAEAEDVAQEACLQAFLTLDRLREPARFGAWLAGIGLNLARMRRRQRHASPLPEDWDGGRLAPGFRYADAQPSAEAECEVRELHAAVLRAISDLPLEQQQAVQLHYWEGLSVAEAGLALGVAAGTIKARLHRARRRLRTALTTFVETSARPERPKEASMIEMTVQCVVLKAGKINDVIEAAGPEAPAPGAEPERQPLPAPAQHRVVVLKERTGDRLLPIWVGPFEGDSIAMLMAGKSTPRPMTFELMARLLEAGRTQVERVTVTRLADEVFYATLTVQAAGQTHAVDARPSDGIALAVRLGVPIYVDGAVLEQAGVAPDQFSDELGEWQPVDPEAVFPPWKPRQAPE